MSIKIICKKIPKVLENINYQPYLLLKFKNYNSKLTNKVKDHEGFHNSESYHNLFVSDINTDNIDSIITLSQWDSYKDWNKWYYSEDRLKIKEEYNEIIEEEKIYVLRKEDSVFLL